MTKQDVVDYLKADLTRRIVISSYKGVKCYSAPEPIGVGPLHGSVIEEMVNEGTLLQEGDCYVLS